MPGGKILLVGEFPGVNNMAEVAKILEAICDLNQQNQDATRAATEETTSANAVIVAVSGKLMVANADNLRLQGQIATMQKQLKIAINKVAVSDAALDTATAEIQLAKAETATARANSVKAQLETDLKLERLQKRLDYYHPTFEDLTGDSAFGETVPMDASQLSVLSVKSPIYKP
jgi:hypothetical protein